MRTLHHPAALAASAAAPDSAEARIDAAFEYAYPLYALARTRWQAVHAPGRPAGHESNRLLHERRLADHTARWITAPNNDTLYSNAWIDLAAGQVQVRVREMPPGRYWSVALLDAFTNHIAVIGQRLEGAGPVELTLIGPDCEVPADAARQRLVRTPGTDVWLFARCLVEGPDDLPRAHAMQDRLEVRPLAGAAAAAPPAQPVDSADAANFLAVVNAVLARNPAPPDDAQLLAPLAAVGLAAGNTDAWERIGAPLRDLWRARIGPLHERLRSAGQHGRRDFQGWIAAAADIGNFGRNHALRASVALGGLGALEPHEAMYFVRYLDDRGVPLHGRRAYRLRVPPSGVPTESFWSFTMYEATADGQRILVDNPLRRYSVGNRTPGLHLDADGALDLLVQHTPPADARARSNWLPAPAGPFQIALRAYLPRAELREGRAPMPTLNPS